jgi:hypothetical protein
MAECIGFLLCAAARLRGARDGRERRQRTDDAHARWASRSIDSRGVGPFDAPGQERGHPLQRPGPLANTQNRVNSATDVMNQSVLEPTDRADRARTETVRPERLTDRRPSYGNISGRRRRASSATGDMTVIAGSGSQTITAVSQGRDLGIREPSDARHAA